jgi:hypothetical protein
MFLIYLCATLIGFELPYFLGLMADTGSLFHLIAVVAVLAAIAVIFKSDLNATSLARYIKQYNDGLMRLCIVAAVQALIFFIVLLVRLHW